MEKRGLSQAVTAVIFIALTLVAVGIVWVIIQNILVYQSEKAETAVDKLLNYNASIGQTTSEPSCVPNSNECGDDGCGGSHSDCSLGYSCQSGTCVEDFNINDGLVLLYSLDNSWQDDSGSGKTLSIYSGDPSFSSSMKIGTHSLDLDGDDAASTSYSSILALGAKGSWGAWYYPLRVPSTGTSIILTHGNDGDVGIYQIAYSPLSEVYCNLGWRHTPPSFYTPLNTWTHVLCTYNGSELKTYVNGELVNTFVDPGISLQSSLPFMIGRQPNNRGYPYYFNGRVDEVSVWNRTLSRGEVSYLYNNSNGVQL